MSRCVECGEELLWRTICDDCCFAGDVAILMDQHRPRAERNMLDDLKNRLDSAILGFIEEAKAAGEAYEVPSMARDYVGMGYTLRRSPEYIQFEGDRRDRKDSRNTWAFHARNERGEAPWVLAILARDAIERVEPARERLIQLLELATYTAFSNITADYLSRVARLYIWGFDLELLTMSRAVLESAMEQLIEMSGGAEDATQRLGLQSLTQLGLANMIKVCGPRYRGVLSHEAERRAFEIKRDADSVLHEMASLTERHKGPLEVIRSLTIILGEAFPEPFDDVGLPLPTIGET